MDRLSKINAIVAQHDLNNHPFYQEWVNGTLPVEKLQAYAADYGHFIGTIAEGWESMGHAELAEEEREHEVLWQDFRNSIGAGSDMQYVETEVLVDLALQEFAQTGKCVGALYAFEAQQPRTSASKLAGLEKFYSVDTAGKKYFEVHANDIREVEILDAALLKMSDEEFGMASDSCEKICKAMWLALDGVYQA
ncbi:MAG TPA: iron-containing redox enzyme family protein [Fimbriimonadaceae bacterium]|jgi:pyrroloquinoline-quinone synthase